MRSTSASAAMFVCLVTCVVLSIFTTLTSSAPLATGNGSHLEPLLTTTSIGTSSFIDGSEPSIVPLALHLRSPMNPAAGPPGGQGQPGSAGAASSSSASAISPADLHSYENNGREFFMRMLLVDQWQAKTLIEGKVKATITWPVQNVLIASGWTEQDLSPQLMQSRFMDRFASTFDRMVVGQGEEGLIAGGGHLRKPSLLVWPNGPNQAIRMVQDQQWRPPKSKATNSGPSGRATMHAPTNAIHDVVYNFRDGILILLRQLPAPEALEKGAPLPNPPSFLGNQATATGATPAGRAISMRSKEQAYIASTWDAGQIWYAERAWQGSYGNPTCTLLGNMPPKLNDVKAAMTGATKRKDIQFIFVPNIGRRQEASEAISLGIIDRCLRSTAKYNLQHLPAYGASASFFPAGSWCTNALLATSTSSHVAMFLGLHRVSVGRTLNLGHKTVVGVHIVKLDAPNDATPTLIWQIADYKAHDSDCAEAWGKITVGEPLPLLLNPSGGSGKGRASVPPDCYPETMRKWQPEAFGGPAHVGQHDNDPLRALGVLTTAGPQASSTGRP